MRLDAALASRGLLRSRSAAAEAVSTGRVRVDGVVVRRPAHPVDPAADLRVVGPAWVSRAALKLVAALDEFAVPVAGRLALDVGASTGGFTQVLLERGAARVLAIDVGHGQLAAEVRADARVVAVEGLNARDLDAGRLAERTGVPARPDLVVADLSFISLTQVLPALLATASPSADLVVLIKPQFEAGRTAVRDGLVTDEVTRLAAVERVLDAARALGLDVAGTVDSPIAGAAGNREVLAHLRRPHGPGPSQWDGPQSTPRSQP